VHWSFDGWQKTHDMATRDTGLGVHCADLPTEALEAGREIVFTFMWLSSQKWEGLNYSVVVEKG
jgi:glucoamylase